MKVLLNRIYKTDDQYRSYSKVFEKGLSFSSLNVLNKDGNVLFM